MRITKLLVATFTLIAVTVLLRAQPRVNGKQYIALRLQGAQMIALALP